MQVCFNFSFSQNEDDIRFNLVTGENGEAIGKITAMTQDPKGYMWFADEVARCLYRYDGFRTTSFRHDIKDPNSLGGNNIFVVTADSSGIIWIGFQDTGLDRYDPTSGVFKHFRHEPKDPSSLSGTVTVMLNDRKGRLWVGTPNGLDRLDKETGKFFHYRNETGNPKSLSDNHVLALYEDSQGTIWVGTGFPWFNKDPDAGGLNRLEADGTFSRFMHDPKDPHSLINNKVRSIFEDSSGTFWVGTSRDGLHTMDRKTGKFERHLYDPARPDKLSRPALKAEEWFNINDLVTFITEDRLGYIWIGSMWSGVNRYNPVTKKIKHYEADNGFPDRTSWTTYQSRDGVMWLSTNETLYRIDFIQKRINNIELGTSVHRFIEDKKGFLWVGTENGLLQLDEQRNLRHRFEFDSGSFTSPLNNICSMFQNQEDTIWIGTHEGFGIFDTRTNTFSRFPLESHFKNGDVGKVITIMQDHLGEMWFTTDKGLMRYNPKDGFIKWYRKDENKPGSLRTNEMITVLEDKSGTIWVGTGTGGVHRLNRDTDEFTVYLEDAKQSSLYEDAEGVLWAGTPTGLYRYNKRDDDFMKYESGSSVSHNAIFAIAEDDARNLWIATPSELVKITPDREEIFTYGRQVGITNVSPGGLHKTIHGEILVGHGSGFFTFIPEKFEKDVHPLKILVADILVNNESIATDSVVTKNRSISTDDIAELSFAYDRNDLIFKYASDDYRAPEATKYFTMLEGYDNVWRESIVDRASYFFTLPPGKYTYRVKAYNAFGAKAEKAIIVRILPPWWKTWWAYSFYGLCGLGLLFFARREIVRRERLRAAFKLEHLELKKAKEVDKVKSVFFTNISHEFRTPLTLIKGNADGLLEEYSDNPKTRERLNMIRQNSDLLLKLISQLMDLAKLESGGLTVNKTESDLNLFLSSLVNSFSSLAIQKNIELTVKLPSNRYLVLFDKDKLETILINLVSNALKFTPSGGSVNVTAMTLAKDASPNEEAVLNILIRDTGIGIPRDLQTKVFERFFQVSESHKEYGTGVGLALVKELTEMMGGTITLTSEPDEGSEFRLAMPISILNLLEDSAIVSPPAITVLPEVELIVSTNGNGQPEKPKLLVVEDNADLRKFIISSLGTDYDFLEAADGKQGLEVTLNEIPELIITDVMMPEMDGIDMTEKIKKDIRTCHIPIIVLTAKASEESKLAGLNSGADDYLTKPFNKNELVLKVRNAIASRARVREKMRLEMLREVSTSEVVSADEQFLMKVRNAILSRLSDEQLSVDSLAEQIGFSRAQFYRKVTALTGMPVNELIRSFRLQKAAQLLGQRWGSVSQVAYEVGFSNPSYFSKCFKDQFGVHPSAYLPTDLVH